MSIFTKSLLLFVLNWLDAQLTIVWVRGGWATEGNGLMARLLDAGNMPFLSTKLLVGALVAYTLFRFSHLALARRGLHFTLGLYLALMLVHAATGASALGWQPPELVVALVSTLPDNLLALFS
ncbi:MAG: hypothetical protein H0T60_16040 [Acidobacteria bacterium]|nr:hypothetical protein [Acidobacteriota bacterium]